MITIQDLQPKISMSEVNTEIITYFLKNFGYNQPHITMEEQPESISHER